MNPLKVQKKEKLKIINKISLFSLTLLFQLLLLSSNFIVLEVPDIIKEKFLITTENHGNVKIGNAYYISPSSLSIKEITFTDKQVINKIILKKIVLKLNSVFLNSISSIDQLLIETIEFNLDKNNINFKINNFDLSIASNKGYFNFSILKLNTRINIKGIVNINYLESILSEKSKSGIRDKSKLFDFLQSINLHLNNYNFKGDSRNINCVINIDKYGIFHLLQTNASKTNNSKNELRCIVHFDLKNKTINDLRSNISNINAYYLNSNLNIKNVAFSYQGNKSKKDEFFYYSHQLILENIKLDGKITGQIPNITVTSKLENKLLDITLISDTNSTQCSNIIKWDLENKLLSLIGNNLISPNLINLSLIKEKHKYVLVKGDSLDIKFNNNLSSPELRQNNTIKINAKKVSFLDSPFGNYSASGYIDSDFSLFLDKIKATMQKSIVNGSYRQNWNPLNYEFNLKGSCLPTDINNWFGSWWANIWDDFKFNSDSIPSGNFKINGIWNKPYSSIANGIFNCENIEYKEFPINYAKLIINVDSNKTLISTSDLKHNYGSLKGSLSIPHFKSKNDILLNYKIDGIYPLNSGKKCMGKHIESYLNKFNLNYLDTSSHGTIYLTKQDGKSAINSKQNYFIDFLTNQSGSWNGIPFNGFQGTIKSEDDKFTLNLPIINFEQSIISLIINSSKHNNSINFEIINGRINELYSAINSFQSYTGEYLFNNQITAFTQNEGIIDFNLHASNYSNDLIRLKGTGMIRVKDKEISKIRLLGFLSDRLSNLPIPFPTGTLNFNKLEGLFELDQGIVKFDKFVLSGFFAKIISKGSINLKSGEINIFSKIQLVGNIDLPILSKIANIADPLSNFAEVKITGTWQKPIWELLVNPLK